MAHCDAPMTCSCRECERAFHDKKRGAFSDIAVRLRDEADRAIVSHREALEEIHVAITPFVPAHEVIATAPWLAERLAELKRLKCEIDHAHLTLRSERDEWKRRAEAAEAHLADPKRCIRIETPAGDLVPLGSIQKCGRLDLLVTRVDGEGLPGFDSREFGDGIAGRNLKPDNSVAHLDEDLLCEDA